MKAIKFLSGAAAVLTLVSGLAAAQPAAARDRGMSPGAAAAVGALGGLAVGTIVGATVAQQPAYAAPAPVYVAPPPPPPPARRVYVEEEPVVYERPARRVYVERCSTERYREWVPGWGWEYRDRQVCR
ncbi:hypothetical protein [Microvirga sp. P5_D2]|jgi:hypothetical protein